MLSKLKFLNNYPTVRCCKIVYTVQYCEHDIVTLLLLLGSTVLKMIRRGKLLTYLWSSRHATGVLQVWKTYVSYVMGWENCFTIGVHSFSDKHINFRNAISYTVINILILYYVTFEYSLKILYKSWFLQ